MDSYTSHHTHTAQLQANHSLKGSSQVHLVLMHALSSADRIACSSSKGSSLDVGGLRCQDLFCIRLSFCMLDWEAR